jgi:hypothetical protein
MKVDWIHSDFSMDFSEMPFPGGQFVQAVPRSLGTVVGVASIHIDKDDGTKYVQVGGALQAPSPSVYIPEGTYWDYKWSGWPILAAIPGDIFNAPTSAADPDYEFGGKYIESGMVAKLDPDGTGPWLQNYNPLFNPPIFQDYAQRSLGNSGPGGAGPEGLAADGTRKTGWNFRAVSQRCWVLIIVDPSGHRVYNTPINPGSILEPPSWDGLPIVLQPQGAFLEYRFSLIWRLGPGSNIPGLLTGGASPTTPSAIHIG